MTEESQDQKETVKMDKMVRRCCFTLNNFTPAEEKAILDLVTKNFFTYILVGYEQGENGTPHLQGYAKLKVRKRWSTLKKIFPERLHFQQARGSTQQNIDYIKHNPNKPPFKCFVEEGNPGKTDDGGQAYEVKEWLEEGLTLNDLLSDTSYTVGSQTVKLFNQLSALYTPKRTWKPEVIWVYGKAGSGKTKWVYDREGDNLYNFQLDKKWFDGYNKHEALLWDDFDLDILENSDQSGRDKLEQQRLLQRLLAICDRYEFKGNVKGSSTQLLAKRVYIVAHQAPWHLWRPVSVIPPGRYNECPTPEEIESNSILSQVMRRITSIKHIILSSTQKIVYPSVDVVELDKKEELPLSQEKGIIRIFKKTK